MEVLSREVLGRLVLEREPRWRGSVAPSGQSGVRRRRPVGGFPWETHGLVRMAGRGRLPVDSTLRLISASFDDRPSQATT